MTVEIDNSSVNESAAVEINGDLVSTLGDQAIEQVPMESLKPRTGNARRHSSKQIDQIAASIQAFGFIGAIIVDQSGTVLAGHGRLEAAKRLGLEAVPCMRIDHLTTQAKRAFALADNRLAELSDWDEDLLRLELEELSSLEIEFDVELTGFDTVDLDRLLGPEPDPRGQVNTNGESTDPDDRLEPLLAAGPAVSRWGDMWHLGLHHKVLCGDALEPGSYDRLLAGELAAQVVSDPPYNVKTAGHVSSKKGFHEFKMAAGEMSRAEFTDFLAMALGTMAKVARDGAIFHMFMDWRHAEELLAAARGASLTFKNLCVWAKPNAGMGTFYRSQHELVFVFKAGSAPHTNNFGLGARGRHRSNVWRYPSVIGQRKGVNHPEGGHQTVKPKSMILDTIKDCSKRGEIILDPFAGSGTTAIAAERAGRKARLIELDAHHVDLIVRRFEVVTGLTARLDGDGRTFAEITPERQASLGASDKAAGDAT